MPITDPSLLVLICCQSVALPVGPVTFVHVRAEADGARLTPTICNPEITNIDALMTAPYFRLQSSMKFINQNVLSQQTIKEFEILSITFRNSCDLLKNMRTNVTQLHSALLTL
jgi:hypothetical protein